MALVDVEAMKLQMCAACINKASKDIFATFGGVRIVVEEMTIAAHSEECARSIEQLTEKVKGSLN